MSRKTKNKFSDFECNLLFNVMNELLNIQLAKDSSTEEVDELLIRIIDKSEK